MFVWLVLDCFFMLAHISLSLLFTDLLIYKLLALKNLLVSKEENCKTQSHT